MERFGCNLLLFLLGVFDSGYLLAFHKIKTISDGPTIGIPMSILNISMMLNGLLLDPLIGFSFKLVINKHLRLYSINMD